MNFLPSLSVSLLAVTCLAADNSSRRAPNNFHDKFNTPVPQNVELVDRAFALGLALGESSDLIIADTPIANTISLSVSPKRLKEFILANSECKREGQTYNPFNGLFDEKCLLRTLGLNNANMNFEHFQRVFSHCMLSIEAKVSVDVAMLKWLVGEIKRETKDYCIVDMEPNILVNIESCIVGPVCSLSFYPQLIERCSEDILTVLNEVENLITSGYFSKDYLLGNFFSIVVFIVSNLLVVDCPIQWKTGLLNFELLQLGCPEYKSACVLVLASAQALTRLVADEEEQQLSSTPKLHSLTNLPSVDPNRPFIKIMGTYLKATITKGILNWESNKASQYNVINIPDKEHPEPRQRRLFIIFKINPPSFLCIKISSCQSLAKFYVLLETQEMKRLILTFGMTILETSE